MDNPRTIAERIIANVERVIVGKHGEVELAVIALLCNGHLLIEDVPGVGKTMLARSMARSLGCSFKRIQFTPDLLPSDVLGVSIYNQKTGDFEFRPGPIFAQIVLADEINRASPKTQSALLECMEEGQVTVDGITHKMAHPFLVMATENPIDFEGTFPLPELQLDRFLMRVSLGYPSPADEVTVIERQQYTHPIEDLGQAVEALELVELQTEVRGVYVDPLIKQYAVSLVGATRKHPAVRLGASPRGSLALFRASQARALLDGRDYVLPDDVKALAEPTLAHRLALNPAALARGMYTKQVMAEVIGSTTVPGARVSRWARS